VKKLSVALVVAILVSILVLAGCSSTSSTPVSSSTQAPASTSTQASVIQLKFAQFFPGPSGPSQVWEKYCNEINKRTNGQVNITFYPGASLLDGPSMADGIQSGIADIGFISIGFTPGRFPVMECIGIPNGYASGYIGTHMHQDVWTKLHPAEFDGYHVLGWSDVGPMVIFSNVEINNLEELKGKRIRSIGRTADIFKELGASPVGTNIGEVYDAMNKGVLDGACVATEAADTWKFAEVSKYLIQTWPIVGGTGFVTAMNIDSWNKLPANVQKIIDDTASEWVEETALMFNQIDFDGGKLLQQNKVKMVDLSADEVTKWKNKAAPVTDLYVQDMVKRGFSESEIRGWLSYIQERNDYWLQKQIDMGLKSATGPAEIRMQ
jgi:TRAP-type C4-dicarboxylate transport system substrate-binding protein